MMLQRLAGCLLAFSMLCPALPAGIQANTQPADQQDESLPALLQTPSYSIQPSVENAQEEAFSLTSSLLKADAPAKDAARMEEGIYGIPDVFLEHGTHQIASGEHNGLFWIDSSSVRFYSFDTKKTETLYSLDASDYEAVYSYMDRPTNKVYFSAIPKDSEDLILSVFDLHTKEATILAQWKNKAHLYDLDYMPVTNDHYLFTVIQNGSPFFVLLDGDGNELDRLASDYVAFKYFTGLDAETGSFYFEAKVKFNYWGESHDGRALGCGKIDGNQIISGNTILYDDPEDEEPSAGMVLGMEYEENNNQTKEFEMLTDGYIAADRVVAEDVEIWQVSGIDQTKPHSNIIWGVARDTYVDDEDAPYYAASTRTFYSKERQSMFIYTADRTIEECNAETGSVYVKYTTKNPVFDFEVLNDQLLVFSEKYIGNKWQAYMEVIDIIRPDTLILSHDENTFIQGEDFQAHVSHNGSESIHLTYTWSSADPSIASVTTTGKVYGWHPGTTQIQVTSKWGLEASMDVTVEEGSLVYPKTSSVKVNGTLTQNLLDPANASFSDIVTSYLYETPAGLCRVEFTGEDILVEQFDTSGKVTSSQHIAMAMDLFGGFFHGQDANYILTGQRNPNEDDAQEILELQEFSSDWNLQRSLKITDTNTFFPFDSGSCRFAETDTCLYIYTCHLMYEASDESHPQANMIFEVDKETLQVSQSFTGASNVSTSGYVSRSLNQFIQYDGASLFRADLGDGSPRGVVLIKSNPADPITQVSYTIPLRISGESSAATNLNLGGFELSDNACIITGHSINQSNHVLADQRNIFLSITDKNLVHSKTVWLTSYEEGSGISLSAPYLIKIADNAFLVLWQEYANGTNQVRAVSVDDQGNVTGSTVYQTVLSGCQPILLENGLVCWYGSSRERMELSRIQPLDLDRDDFDGDTHTHVHGEPTFIFSDHYTKCTAVFTCSECQEQVERECTVTRIEDGNYYTITADIYEDPYDWSTSLHLRKEVVEYGHEFVDVPETMWYFEVVYKAATEGLMTGYDEDHFIPNDNMTRGMAATVLYRMAGSPPVSKSSGFSDVKDSIYYSDAIAWAAENGIVTGYTGKDAGRFGPDDDVTREQLCTMVFRYLNWAGANTSARKDLDRFKDGSQVSEFAREAVEFCTASEIISGAENSTMLYPQKEAVRAECAKILLNAYTLQP